MEWRSTTPLDWLFAGERRETKEVEATVPKVFGRDEIPAVSRDGMSSPWAIRERSSLPSPYWTSDVRTLRIVFYVEQNRRGYEGFRPSQRRRDRVCTEVLAIASQILELSTNLHHAADDHWSIFNAESCEITPTRRTTSTLTISWPDRRMSIYSRISTGSSIKRSVDVDTVPGIKSATDVCVVSLSVSGSAAAMARRESKVDGIHKYREIGAGAK